VCIGKAIPQVILFSFLESANKVDIGEKGIIHGAILFD
jgi:hypothetical protein